MPVHIQEDTPGGWIELRVSGKLTPEDYEQFVPEVERLIREQGRIDLLFEMSDFHGWRVAAAWEDLKFGIKHFSDIRRVAMVGEKQWQHWMSDFCRPFTKAEVRYFDHDQMEEARAWLAERD